MNIAIPSNDGLTVSAHFGRSRGFIVFKTSKQEILSEEYRENTVTGHALGQHTEHTEEHHHQNGEHTHSHTGILGVLADCEAVIAGGMGQRLFNDLTGAGKKVFVSREENARQAVKLLLTDQLDSNPDVCCQH